MAFSGSTVHVACAFSIVEIMSVLYDKFLNYPENNPVSDTRDYLVLSKGHGVMAQYACMFEKGWLTEEDLENYFSNGTLLTGLADSKLPGIEATTGSLGHGLSVAVGLALGSKIQNSKQKTFVVVGDGEINEGSIWEAALFASQHELRNLMIVVDENGLQAMGTTTEILNLGDISAKFQSFGFDALKVDGHNLEEIEDAINALFSRESLKPKALICKTVKGKGVSFMENDNTWHYTRLNADTHAAAIAELKEI